MRALDQTSSAPIILSKRSQVKEELPAPTKNVAPTFEKSSGRSSTMGNILTRVNQHELRVEGIMIDYDNILVQANKAKPSLAQNVNGKLKSALSTIVELQEELQKVNESGGCTSPQYYQSSLRL
jgi:hypothetical protein